METIADRLAVIEKSLPADGRVSLVAVSKYQPIESILEAYLAGQRLFGESRVQELEKKASLLPQDIEWNFIGHLQSNKVSKLLNIKNLHLIQSVDSLRLLEIIDREALKKDIIARVLLEVHVAAESTKTGFMPADLIDWFSEGGYQSLKATHIHGLMGMASNTGDKERIRSDFDAIAKCYKKIHASAPELTGFNILSMGMSSDYDVAILEGATMIRVGSSIFGVR